MTNLPTDAKWIRADLVLPGDHIDLRHNIFVDPQGIRNLPVFNICTHWTTDGKWSYLTFADLGEFCFSGSHMLVLVNPT